MNKLLIVGIVVIIIVGVLAGIFLLAHKSSSVLSPTSSSIPSTTTTSSMANTSSTNKMKNTGPITGTILYEIIAPAEIDGENYTYIWLVINISNPSNYTANDVLGTTYLNGKITIDFEVNNYPFGAPKYEQVGDELFSDSLGPKQKAVGWIAFELSGYYSSLTVEYLQLNYYWGPGPTTELVQSYLYPASNFTVIHADQIYFMNSSVSLAEYPFTNYFFVVPNVKVTVPIGIGVSTNIANITVENFNSPLIRTFNLPMIVNVTNFGEAYANITLELTHYVPYAVTTYIYIEQ